MTMMTVVGYGKSCKMSKARNSESPVDVARGEASSNYWEQVQQLVSDMKKTPISRPRPGVKRIRVN